MAYRKTLSDLRTAVRTNVDESTAAFWTDANLNAMISRAADMVWQEIRKLRGDYFLTNRASTDGSVTIYGDSYATSSFALVAGTREYTLPQDLAELKLIECITSGYEYVGFHARDLAHPDMRAARQITEQLSPTDFFYDVVGERTLTLAPHTNTALDLRLWYVPRTVIVSSAGASLYAFASDTDELVLPHPAYLAVEELATSRAQIRDDNPTALMWQQLAAASVARFLGSHARVQANEHVVGLFE